MKKLLAFTLAIMVLLSMSTMFTSVGAASHDANGIASIDYLDFSPANNKWDERDAEGNLLYTSFNDSTMIEKDGKYYYPHATYLENDGYNKNLDYEFLQGGEVIRLTATADDNPAIAFDFATLRTFAIGSQDNGGAEYVKIRFKNNSPSTKLTFMGTNESLGAGKLDSRIRATIDVEANSSEWQTITISMVDGTLNTVGSKNWSSYLKRFAIFPFGYSKDYEGIANEKYYVDIDYVVIGSYEYVTSYQSALETKENAAIDFSFESTPTVKEYFLGQTLDLDGLQASIKYGEDQNGNPLYADETVGGEGVSAIYNFDKPLDENGEPIDKDSWTSTVTLMYGSLLLTYDVTVYDIEEIQFEYADGKTKEEAIDNKVYDRVKLLLDGKFLPEDLSVKVVYSKLLPNGEKASEIKTMQEVNLIGTEFTDEVELSEAGYYEYLVTVNYHGHVLYLPVKLIDIAELVVTPLDEKKDSIYYGTQIDSSFFDIQCKYTNGDVKALADTGLASYFGVTCNTKTTGGETNATASLINAAYNVNVVTNVPVMVQTPVDIKVTLRSANYDVDDVIAPSRFTVKYTYADGTTATVDQDDPNLIFNYDTSVPGQDIEGTVKIGDKKATFEFNVNEAEFDPEVIPVDRGGAKVTLLKAKVPTALVVTAILGGIVLLAVGAWALLKFVFKVEFKRKKRVSLDDIF